MADMVILSAGVGDEYAAGIELKMIVASDIYDARLRPVSGFGNFHRQGAEAGQPGAHRCHIRSIQMLQDGAFRSAGKLCRMEATARGPPVDAPRAIQGAVVWQGCSRHLHSAFQRKNARERLDFADQFLLALQVSIDAGNRSRDRTQSSITECFEHQPCVAEDSVSTQENAAWRLGHNAAGSLDTVHSRHDQIHQDQVWPVADANLNRLLTAPGSPGHRHSG
jgi:hypothetical protein